MWWKPKNIIKMFPEVSETMRVMRLKDHDLAESVFVMSIMDGIGAWRERYPEDFKDGGLGVPGPHNIEMPRGGN